MNKKNIFYVVINKDKTDALILQVKPTSDVPYYEVESEVSYYEFLDKYKKCGRESLIDKLNE